MNKSKIAFGTNLNFLTWNVKGINNSIKRSKVFAHLKRLNADIIFLQETHLQNKDHYKLKHNWCNDGLYRSRRTQGLRKLRFIKRTKQDN